MATYHAIAAVGQTLVGMLKDASAETEFAGFPFELYQAVDFKPDSPLPEGLTLYLYRVAVNTSRRNLPPTVGVDGRRYRPPIPLDLFYLLTPWGKTAAVQHRLLGWAMRELQNMPVLPAALLNNYVPEKDTFKQSEAVEVICDPIPMQDMANVLDTIKLTQQLSVSYVARMVLIESKIPIMEGESVQTRVLDYGVLSEQ